MWEDIVNLQKLDVPTLQSSMRVSTGSSSLGDGRMSMDERLLVDSSFVVVAICMIATLLRIRAARNDLMVRHVVRSCELALPLKIRFALPWSTTLGDHSLLYRSAPRDEERKHTR